ncbi:carbohydrate ABC transporter permease [Cohnella soli]|uniref:Carbohydrate ABC transporter permease n=1 Tax=Cohnella soli TaxID=425005 RepID=A0ABW0HPP6_9BACL
MNLRTQRNLVIFGFLFVPVSLLLLFLAYPTVELFRYSFTNWDGYSPTMTYIGFDNYKQVLFDMPDAWHAIRNNGIYFIIHAIAIPLELLLAVLLNRAMRGSSFFRFSVLFPYIINGVAVAYMFSYVYYPFNGPLNVLLTSLGLESWIQKWLSNPDIVNYSLVVVSIWRFSGVHVILFLAGLQAIPKDLYEAAEVDGAGFWRKQFHITFPGVRRVMEIILFMNISGALLQFDIPFVMTGGGPGNASSTFGLFSLFTAFKFNSFGLASAMAVILLLMIIVFSVLQNWLVKERGSRR